MAARGGLSGPGFSFPLLKSRLVSAPYYNRGAYTRTPWDLPGFDEGRRTPPRAGNQTDRQTEADDAPRSAQASCNEPPADRCGGEGVGRLKGYLNISQHGKGLVWVRVRAVSPCLPLSIFIEETSTITRKSALSFLIEHHSTKRVLVSPDHHLWSGYTFVYICTFPRPLTCLCRSKTTYIQACFIMIAYCCFLPSDNCRRMLYRRENLALIAVGARRMCVGNNIYIYGPPCQCNLSASSCARRKGSS